MSTYEEAFSEIAPNSGAIYFKIDADFQGTCLVKICQTCWGSGKLFDSDRGEEVDCPNCNGRGGHLTKEGEILVAVMQFSDQFDPFRSSHNE